MWMVVVCDMLNGIWNVIVVMFSVIVCVVMLMMLISFISNVVLLNSVFLNI